MKKTLLFLVTLLTILTGCTYETGARKVLADQGYTNVEITGWKAFTCGKGYEFSTGFKAMSIAKRPVSGAVCDGLMTGAVIKLDD
jgi:hypothetical protein